MTTPPSVGPLVVYPPGYPRLHNKNTVTLSPIYCTFCAQLEAEDYESGPSAPSIEHNDVLHKGSSGGGGGGGELHSGVLMVHKYKAREQEAEQQEGAE